MDLVDGRLVTGQRAVEHHVTVLVDLPGDLPEGVEAVTEQVGNPAGHAVDARVGTAVDDLTDAQSAPQADGDEVAQEVAVDRPEAQEGLGYAGHGSVVEQMDGAAESCGEFAHEIDPVPPGDDG